MSNKMFIWIKLMTLIFIGVTLAMMLFILFYDNIPKGYQLPPFILPLGVIMLGKTTGTLYCLSLLILGYFLLIIKEIARKIFIWIQGINIFLGECFAIFAVGWMTGVDGGTRFMNFLYLSFLFNLLSIVFFTFFMLPIVKKNFQR